MECELESVVFISHRSMDKEIADMLFDFLIRTGIPREYMFCSSLPGNDVDERINTEVKSKLKNSSINIAILSLEYYQSAYCLNEAGIMWFCDKVLVIPIALPEVSEKNMYGFLNSEYKIRRLNNDGDISYIYDSIRNVFEVKQCKASIVTAEISKLKNRYETYISKRIISHNYEKSQDIFDISSDDEAVILYYIIERKIRKVKKGDMISWMKSEELYNVNVDNAFDLLATLGNGNYTEETLELDIDIFRKYVNASDMLLPQLHSIVENNRKLSSFTFEDMWKSGEFDDIEKLFIAYIIEEKIVAFGDRWMAEGQIEDIKCWESKNSLDSILSTNYGSCLSKFIENDLVYESSWTSYGNPREYSLCTSLKAHLFAPEFQYMDIIIKNKQNHNINLPY